jgi:hypothetical protein
MNRRSGINEQKCIAVIATVCLAFSSACATDPRDEFTGGVELAELNEAALGGEALAQRKSKLQRAVSDMGHFQKTLESMRDRTDHDGVNQLRGFINEYVVSHLNPLLAPTWQSSHPELIVYDASLRFVQAEVLTQLGYSGWTNKLIRDMVARYKGRDNMLVDYPASTQTTFGEALVLLRSSKRAL